MIRARESLDRWAHAAHNVLDQAQTDRMVPGHQIAWALAYLGDRTGNSKVPSDIQAGYDAAGQRIARMHADAPPAHPARTRAFARAS